MKPLVLSALLAVTPAALAADGGTLVIVGGGLRASNAAVHRAFLDARPASHPRIAIIPAASGAPHASATSIADTFVRYGARRDDIVIIQLAQEDDPGTADVDERIWARGATDPAEIARIADAGAIWFTGGDQLRSTSLLAPGGRDTPMLKALRARLAAGAVIGGTSAGAAIMSGAMITEGDPLASLLKPVSRQAPVEAGAPDNRVSGGGLVIGKGLGFLPMGLVDQHFDARRRLGRLARALFEQPPSARFGFGIDEDTGLVVDLARGTAHVVGSASVTLLDARSATRSAGTAFGAEGLRLAVAGPGDRIDLGRLAVSPAAAGAGKAPDADEEQPRVHHRSGGMAVPEPPVGVLLADSLFGAGAPAALERPSFRADQGVVYRFSRLPDASRWETDGHVSVSGIGFSLHPVTLSFAAAGLQ